MTHLGTITGAAIGDALGMPFETRSPEDPSLLTWDGTYGSSEHHGLGPGQFTDDTQMTMALAETLCDGADYDPIKAAEAYLRWFQSGDCRGMGTSTRRALKRLQSGVPWTESGEQDAEGNGTAMRASPLGSYFAHNFPDNPQWLASWARNDSMITHQSLEAEEGSAAIALAIHHLALEGAKDTLLSRIIPHLRDSLLKTRLQNILTVGVVSVSERYPEGIPCRVIPTVDAALCTFLTTESFKEAVMGAIRLGGDTDTVGSVTGALAGTFYGYEAIPQVWKDGLERASEIRDLESKLLK